MTEGRRVATHRGVSPERKKRTFQVVEIACLGSSCVSKNLCKKILKICALHSQFNIKKFQIISEFVCHQLQQLFNALGSTFFRLPIRPFMTWLHHPPLSPCHSKVLLPGASSELHSHSRAFAHARRFCHLSSFPRIIFLIFQVSQLKTPFCGKTLCNPHQVFLLGTPRTSPFVFFLWRTQNYTPLLEEEEVLPGRDVRLLVTCVRVKFQF